MVLVGGEGTRLRPLTYGTPKPMIPIMGVPFLELMLRRIKDAGIEHAILASGYLPDAISSYFGDGSGLGLRLTYVVEESPMGTAGAIKNVEQHIVGPFFVFNGDVLTSLDLRAMIAFHEKRRGMGALHLITVEDPSAFGAVVHDNTGRITAFVEKPPKGTSPSNDVNAGTYLLEREILDHIPAGRAVSIERETFPTVISGGNALYAHVTSDYWIDLGRPEHYHDAHHHIFDGTMPLAIPFSKGAISGPGKAQPPGTVTPPAFIGANVVIEPGAHVGPLVVLGEGCRVARGARIEDSLLWDGVTVGQDAVIEQSIIASGTRVGARARVAPRSVIGHNVVIDDDAQLSEGARVAAEGVPAP
ncbi:MAG: sugar phosphate nucleotidyltransferase [Vulcanimicrobiaceae bacterium]